MQATPQTTVLTALATALVALVASLGARDLMPPRDDMPLRDALSRIRTIEESGSPAESADSTWWLDSGGRLVAGTSSVSTMTGSAPLRDNWREEYARTNPRDTDDGARPQNIFRLVSRPSWHDVQVTVTAEIVADDFSVSANRNESNGVLIMSRYRDGDTLYYAGVRVDGTAIIKKKFEGTYHTLAQVPIFPGTYQGPQSDQNLIPHGEWLTLRSETVTHPDASVAISLYLRRADGPWQLIAAATDRGQHGGTPPIHFGRVGLRTDFMDVQFKDLSVEPL